MSRFPRAGRVDWLAVRPGRRQPMLPVSEVRATAGQGLDRDHYRPGGKGARQVTLIQSEHLPVVCSLLGIPTLDPALLRRNVMVSGINLSALKGKRFRLGDAVLEGTGLCHPCSRMEEALGKGGYNAMRGHGGLNARILASGMIRLKDDVIVL